MKLRKALPGLMALALTVLLVGFAPANVGASTRPHWDIVPQTQAAASASRTIPSPSAPTPVWQAWSANQRAAVESVPWAQLLAWTGCSLTSVQYSAVTVSLGGIEAPPGVTSTAFVLTFHCTQGNQPAFLNGTSTAAAQTSPVSTQSGDPCRTISGPGAECVAPLTYNGTPNWIDSSYTYHGSSTTGHDELSEEAIGTQGNCHPGTALKNGPTRTFTNDQAQVVGWGPRNSDAVWDGTFWHSRSGGYTDYGNECGLF